MDIHFTQYKLKRLKLVKISDKKQNMNYSDEGSSRNNKEKKYKGVRLRKWGKWVSEIRVPSTEDRLWLGTYSTPEGAAVAFDIATYCLRGPSSSSKLNFSLTTLPAGVRTDLSPRSVQKVASDAGMAVDAQLALAQGVNGGNFGDSGDLNISVEDYHW